MSMDEDDDLLWQTFINSLCDIHPGQAPPPAQSPLPSLPSYLTSDANTNTNFETTASTATATFPAATSSLFEEEIDDPNIDPDYDIIKDLQSIEFEDEDLNLSEYLSFINEPQLLTDPESVASTSAAAAADHIASTATSSSDADVSVNKDYFTAEQGKTLQSQLAFHLQALTQTHLLASANAEHQSLKEGSKQMLDELAKFTESTEKTIQDSRSSGTACTVNLAFEGVPASAALTFLSDRGPQIVKAERRNSSKGIEIISEFFRRSILSRRDIFQFDWAFPSKRFLIGEPPLLPQLKCDGEEEGEEGEDGEEGAAEDGAAAEEQKDGKKQLAVAKKTYFSLAEDWLLALAMDEQKRRSISKRAFRALFDLITELKFLPSKTATSLRLHIKYFRRQLARIEELTEEELAEKRNHALAEIARNPVMHYLKHGRLPPVAGFEDPQRDVYRSLRRPPRWLRRREKEDDKDELQIVLEPPPPAAATSEQKAAHQNPQQQLRPLQPAIPATVMMPQMPIEVIYHQPGYTIITLPPTTIDTSSSLQTQLQLQQLQQEQQQLQQLQQQQQQLHQQQLLLPHMTPILPFPSSSSSTSSSFVVEATTSVSATSTTTTSVTNSAAMNDVLDLKKQRIEGRKRRSRSVSLKKSSPKATTSEETSGDDPLLPPTKRVRFDDRIEVYVFSSSCSGHESGSSSGSAVLNSPCPSGGGSDGGGGESTDTFEAEGVDGGDSDDDDDEGSPSVSSSSSSSPSSAEEVVEEDEVNALILEGAEPSNCDDHQLQEKDDQPCNSDNGNQTEISSSSPPDDVPKATIEKVPFPPPPKAADSSPPEPQEEEAEEEEEVAEGEEEEEDDDIIEEFVAPESDDFIIEEEEVEEEVGEDAEDGPEMMAMEEELEEEELEEEEVIEEEEAAGELADDYDEHDEHDLHALMMASCTAVSNRARQASLSADNHHDSTTSSAASSSNQQQLTGPTKITKSRAIALERQSTLYLLRKRAGRVEHSAEEEQCRAQFVAYYLKRAQEVLGGEAYVDFLGRLVSLQAQMEVQKKMKGKKNAASSDLAAARQLYQGIRGFLTGLKRSCSENSDSKIALSEIDELLDMVVLFLSYQQAAAAGEAFRHLHWRRVLDFTRQVELYLGFLYHNKRTQRGAIQRLIKSLRQIGQMKQQKEENGDQNSAINIEAAMKAKMKAVVGRSLNGHTLLLNEFSTLFLDDAPPACLYASPEDFEEFRLDDDEEDEEEGGVEIEEVEDDDDHQSKKRPRFERVTVPLGKADQLYGTSECPCRRCHHRVPSNSNDQPPPVTISGDDQPTTSASASTTSKTDQRITSHCESCSIRFISGRLYVPQYNSSVKKVQLVEHVLREDQETEEAVEGEEETEEVISEEVTSSLPSRKWTIEEDRLLLEACQRAIVEWQVTELTAHLFTAVAKKVAGRFVGKEPARSTGELADRLRLLVEMVTTGSSASASTSTSTSSVSSGST